MPKVSVLMPVYKTKEEYLKKSIESILNQTFKDFELIILDDCPEDNREIIIKSYKDERIKYFKNEKNLGISKTRNKLIELSNGEYLAIFDHDDISLNERFAKEVEYLDNNKDVGVVSCNIKYILSKKISKYPTEDKDIKLYLMSGCCIVHSASMIRKSVLINNKIYYEEEFSPAEDYMLWCRLIPYTKFHNINEILFHYRDHIENTTHKQTNKMKNADHAIKVIIREKYKELYEEFLLKAKKIKYFKLFGFLPILKIVKFNNTTKIYLFKKILILTIKMKIKI